MNSIFLTFTIKDLEHLSGIKAHTIRIWEKRYGILTPERTDTNIRYYGMKQLKKLLNVALLYRGGYKISKIGALADSDIERLVLEYNAKGDDAHGYVDQLVLAMLQFDQKQFEQIYNRLTADFSFRYVFVKVFVPLLYNVGLQWQSDQITPAHEHFISNLIKQKLHLNIERVQQQANSTNGHAYVLFLPQYEIHELGLLYLNYELLLNGYNTVYLGQSVPLDSLVVFKETHKELIFISYFTIFPTADDLPEYLTNLEEIMRPEDAAWLGGRQVHGIESSSKNIILFKDIEEMINKVSN